MSQSIQQLLIWASSRFKPIASSPALDAEVILAHVLKKPREYLYTNSDKKLSPALSSLYKKLVSQRIRGIPVAYITGQKEFFGREFSVNKHVLIPRPETEGLIELVLERITSYNLRPTSYHLLDLGTGSGCIAVTLACELTPFYSPSLPRRQAGLSKRGLGGVKIFASDISTQALAVAKKNAQKHRVKIRFVQSNLFQKLPRKKFNFIVANLPYVRSKDYRKLRPGLKYEPKTALTDGHNTWPTYKKFFHKISDHLTSPAQIFLEIDPVSKKTLAKWAQAYLRGSSMNFYKDLKGKVRYAYIQIN